MLEGSKVGGAEALREPAASVLREPLAGEGWRRASQGQGAEGALPIGLIVTPSWSWSEGPHHSFLFQV